MTAVVSLPQRSVRRTTYQFALLTIGVALTASACGGNDNSAKRTVFVATLPPTFRHPRCLNVPPTLVNAIRSGVTAQGGASLRYAQAVKSADFSSVYFVSADIQATGLGGSDDVATWATNRLRVGGLIYSVDAFANKYSDWPDGYQTNAKLTMIDEGAELSQECVKAVAKR
jgi:hypothetical protein